MAEAAQSLSTDMEVGSQPERMRRSLLHLCLGVLGRHFEDIMEDLDSIAPFLPAPVKMSLLAISRRRGLLTNEVLLSLADESWEMLDVSGSMVTDLGLEEVSMKCHGLKALDISRCNNLSASSIKALVRNCPSLRTLRCGGTISSDAAAKESLRSILPGLNAGAEAEDSWEALELKEIGRGAQSLRWLIWPSIDKDSQEHLIGECPKIVVNPTSSAASFRFSTIPLEALSEFELDRPAVMGIDPVTWADKVETKGLPVAMTIDTKLAALSIAERFKLAFVERDERLAPKRAKNLRQNQRRAAKAWLSSDTDAKAVVLAGFVQKTLRK